MTIEHSPIIAVGGFGLGGNSRAARSARARMQRRDKYGRFAEMGGGFLFNLRLRGFSGLRPVSGRVVGASGDEDIEIEVSNVAGLKDGIYAFPSSRGESIQAVLPKEYLESRGVKTGGDGADFNDVFVSQEELKQLDAPTGWKKIASDESTLTETFQSDDGYFALKKWSKDSKQPPTYSLHRADLSDNSVGDKVADGDSWADIQDAAAKDSPQYEKVLEAADNAEKTGAGPTVEQQPVVETPEVQKPVAKIPELKSPPFTPPPPIDNTPEVRTRVGTHVTTPDVSKPGVFAAPDHTPQDLELYERMLAEGPNAIGSKMTANWISHLDELQPDAERDRWAKTVAELLSQGDEDEMFKMSRDNPLLQNAFAGVTLFVKSGPQLSSTVTGPHGQYSNRGMSLDDLVPKNRRTVKSFYVDMARYYEDPSLIDREMTPASAFLQVLRAAPEHEKPLIRLMSFDIPIDDPDHPLHQLTAVGQEIDLRPTSWGEEEALEHIFDIFATSTSKMPGVSERATDPDSFDWSSDEARDKWLKDFNYFMSKPTNNVILRIGRAQSLDISKISEEADEREHVTTDGRYRVVSVEKRPVDLPSSEKMGLAVFVDLERVDGVDEADTVVSPPAEELEQVSSVGDPTAPGGRDNPIDISEWEKVGAQAGSNPGGFYRAPDGREYYAKRARSASHAENERLASLLYDRAGVDAVSIFIAQRDGEMYTVSPIRESSGESLSDRTSDDQVLDKIREGFAVDAWLANWDVAGLTFDNIIIGKDGEPIRVDPGGALMWRAQGEPKGKAFGDQATEIDTLRDTSMNYSSGVVFGDITEDQVKAGVERIAEISPEEIDSIVDYVVSDAEDRKILKTKLKNRRQYLMDRYGVSDLSQEIDTERAVEISDTGERPGLADSDVKENSLELAGMSSVIQDMLTSDPSDVSAYIVMQVLLGNIDLHKRVLKKMLAEEYKFPETVDDSEAISRSQEAIERSDHVFSYELPRLDDYKTLVSWKQAYNTEDWDKATKTLEGLSDWLAADILRSVKASKKRNYPNGFPGHEVKDGVPDKWRGAILSLDKQTGVVTGAGVSYDDTQAMKRGTLSPPTLPFFIPIDDDPTGETGEGYYFASSGKRYWGKYGAAGALVRVLLEDGEYRYLLGKRADWISAGGGKWAYPGGAHSDREASIAPGTTAFSELREELGIDLDQSATAATHVAHVEPDWKYTTVVADVDLDRLNEIKISDNETSEIGWFTADQLREMAQRGELHPSFASSLDDILRVSEMSKPDSLAVSKIDGVQSLVESIRAAVDGKRMIESTLVDGLDIEDLLVNTTVRDVSLDRDPIFQGGDDVHPVISFKLTPDAGELLLENATEEHQWLTIGMPGTQLIQKKSFDRSTGRFTTSSRTLEDAVDRPGEGLIVSMHSTQASTLQYVDPQGRFSIVATPYSRSAYGETQGPVTLNTVEIEFSTKNPSEDLIAEAMKMAGVRSPRPAKIEDVRAIVENRLLRVLGNLGLGETISDERRATLLQEIENEYGVTPKDASVRRSSSGFVELVVPERLAETIIDRTGLKGLSHWSSFVGMSRTGYPDSTAKADMLVKMLFEEDGSLSSLMSSATRFKSGVTVLGQSSEHDIISGSGDYVFLSMNSPEELGSLLDSADSAVFFFDPRAILTRLDIWANARDRFGSMTAHSDVIGQIAPGNYEIMLKHRVPVDSMTAVYVDKDTRTTALETLRARGITEVNGTPVEHFIAPQGTGVVWTADVEKAYNLSDRLHSLISFNDREFGLLQDYISLRLSGSGEPLSAGLSDEITFDMTGNFKIMLRSKDGNVVIVSKGDSVGRRLISVDTKNSTRERLTAAEIEAIIDNIDEYEIMRSRGTSENTADKYQEILLAYDNGEMAPAQVLQSIDSLASERMTYETANDLTMLLSRALRAVKRAKTISDDQHGDHDEDRDGVGSPEQLDLPSALAKLSSAVDKRTLYPPALDFVMMSVDNNGDYRYSKYSMNLDEDSVVVAKHLSKPVLITMSTGGDRKFTVVDANTGVSRDLEPFDVSDLEDLEFLGTYGKTGTEILQDIAYTFRKNKKKMHETGLMTAVQYFNYLRSLATTALPPEIRSEILDEMADLRFKVMSGEVDPYSYQESVEEF